MAKKSKRTIPALMYQYQGPQRNVGFVLSPLYIEESVEVEMEDMLFIYNEDFDYICPALDRVFPLTDPRTGEEMKALDPCWENPITTGSKSPAICKLVDLGLFMLVRYSVYRRPKCYVIKLPHDDGGAFF
ncbi:hypothetical protein [Paenibacillus sp. W2I17]|uniref:hypothetical protein n=1 Tax=Paenibacillus sp. W2I17 TaxID=3042311 RepID=UPI0027883F95|nr:hypothetical protein [Paenibacillus sp. W2I17]MDQ0661022.1 hypothetical protein [Paenibacillus sp. W2I17]